MFGPRELISNNAQQPLETETSEDFMEFPTNSDLEKSFDSERVLAAKSSFHLEDEAMKRS